MLASSSRIVPAVATSRETSAATEEETEVEQAAREAEFYFSDINLPYDKYMWELHTANPMHAVPLADLLSLPRMKRFSRYGADWLADALKDSTALEVDQTKTFVRRRTEVTEPKDFTQRTVYVSGFGLHRKHLKDELRTFFESKYSDIIGYKLRQEQLGYHKAAAVFLEFPSISAAKRFIDSPSLTWGERQLTARTMEEYLDSQVWSQLLTRKDAQKYAELMVGRTRSPPFNAFAQKAGTVDEASSASRATGSEEPRARIYIQFLGRRIRVYDEGREFVRPEDVPVVRDATLEFSGIAQGHIDRREPVRLLAQNSSHLVPWVQYTQGDTSGYLVFDKPLSSEDAAFVRTTLGTLFGQPVAWAFLDRENERRVQLDAAAAMARRARQVARRHVRELKDKVFVWSHLQGARRDSREPRTASSRSTAGESDIERNTPASARERREPRMVDRLQRQRSPSMSFPQRR
ncbi:La protein -like protein [Phanerochaete sordida]|uniref:La protein -like protein n=1 Tax=Phanerochaete sordida TaxID=48140 RepID=A0A9P3L9U2_9APHY|nr:La protein -like protein [Phanerochaete sordida]